METWAAESIREQCHRATDEDLARWRERYETRGLQPLDRIREIVAEVARRSGLDSSPASVDLAGLIWEKRDAASG